MSRILADQMRGAIRRFEAPRRTGRAFGRVRPFQPSDEVRALVEVHNEGTYPHREIGERLVHPGDAGVVREIGACFGETCYAVVFVARAVVVAMRAGDMIRAAEAAASIR